MLKYCILINPPRANLQINFAIASFAKFWLFTIISQDHSSDLGAGVKRIWVIGIMVAVTIVKLCLLLYCCAFKNEIVRAYAQDHFFDVITNSIGLVAAILAQYFYWWIDPGGAILVSFEPPVCVPHLR